MSSPSRAIPKKMLPISDELSRILVRIIVLDYYKIFN